MGTNVQVCVACSKKPFQKIKLHLSATGTCLHLRRLRPYRPAEAVQLQPEGRSGHKKALRKGGLFCACGGSFAVSGITNVL
jgi:hypothetical protein